MQINVGIVRNPGACPDITTSMAVRKENEHSKKIYKSNLVRVFFLTERFPSCACISMKDMARNTMSDIASQFIIS